MNEKEGGKQLRSILNKNLLRQLELLEVLYKEGSWVTLDNIAQKLKCSERILRDDIKLINHEFEPFQIETSVKGLILTYPSHYSADYIYQKVLSLSPEFSFIERIFFDEKYNLETMAEELFISPSTLRRIITKLNKFFERHKVKILTNPCKITGNESNIRSIMIQFFYEKYGVTHSPFKDSQVKILDQLFMYVAQKNNIKLNFPDLIRLRYWIMVNIIRLKNNHLRRITEDIPNNIDLSILENKSFCRLFKSTFHLDFSQENVHQLFYIFFNNKYAFTYEQLEYMIKNKSNNAWIVVPKIINLLSNLSNKLKIPIENKQKIILEIYNLQNMFFVTDSILNDKRRCFSDYTSHEFSCFVLILKKELKRFKFHENFKWHSNYFIETLYILIVNWTSLSSSLKDKVPSINVGIFCDSDIEHTVFIQNILNYQFGHFIRSYVIDTFCINSFKNVAKNYDLIITNISGLHNIQTSLICINTIPSSQDLNKVQKKIFSLIQGVLSEKLNI